MVTDDQRSQIWRFERRTIDEKVYVKWRVEKENNRRGLHRSPIGFA